MALVTIPSLMAKAATFAMPAIAITDISNLYATVKFYQEAFKVGIKPIIGVDLWVSNASIQRTFIASINFALPKQ